MWAKNKIEIDITPLEEHSFGIVNFLSTSSNFVMAYWNKDTKKYEGIGNGNEFDKYKNSTFDEAGLQTFLSEKAIGFGASLDNGSVAGSIASASFLIGNPISNFGFPSTNTYEATSSNCIAMKDYISEPFLVEKMVLYFSGALNYNNYFAETRGCLTTFFVLNQRKGFIHNVQRNVSYNSGSLSELTTTIDNSDQMTMRDLVSWVQISKKPYSGLTDFDKGLDREYNYDGYEYNQQFVVSGVIKSPLEYSEGLRMAIASVDDNTRNTVEYIETLEQSGRNLTEDRGRSYVNPWQTSPSFGAITLQSVLPGIPPVNTFAKAKYHKPNPYLLLPTDNLVFGFQVPYSTFPFNQFFNDIPTYNGLGPTLSASASGIHKVVFYGSLLRDNKEHHDTFETGTELEMYSVKLGP